MDLKNEALNHFFVDVFNEILKTEEVALSGISSSNLSMTEIHVIESVCKAEDSNTACKASDIAQDLRITAGTLTTAVSILEKKGYLTRQRNESDKRIVNIRSTELGREVNAIHAQFHKEMIDDVLDVLTEEEIIVLLRALGSISTFFRAKYRK